jgi:hypothetical protein
MSLKESVIRIWKNKGQILEGITNSIFKREDVELIATERMNICRVCDLYDTIGTGCVVKGTEPCCDQSKGGCGCSLGFKTRSLSSDCPLGKWKAEITQAEEDFLKSKLGI